MVGNRKRILEKRKEKREMVATATNDPFDTAMSTEAFTGPRTYFGQMTVNVWFCALVKGQGKVVFDPGQHSQDQRCTAIEIQLLPMMKGDTFGTFIERKLIAESKEWASIIKTSLKEIGRDLRSMHNAWVQVQMVPTGRTYKQRDTGETREASTFKFVAVYGSEQECRRASEAFYLNRGNTQQAAAPASTTPPTNGNSNGGTSSAEKETASKFLPALWQSSGRDVTKLAEALAKNPLTSRYFTIDSPEVIAIVSQ
jgi:hypothetical protein